MVARRLTLSCLVVGCVMFGVFGLAVSSALAFQTHLFEGGFGADGTSATNFVRPASVAVDQSTGNVYVGEAQFGQLVEKFDSAHEQEPFTGIAPNIVEGKLTGLGGEFVVAVDSVSHDLLVASGSGVRAFQSDGEPADFTAGPGMGTNEIVGSEVCGVAVNAEGDIYVGEFSSGVHVFNSSGEPLTSIPTGGLCRLAVDSHGTVYATATAGSGLELAGPVEKFAASEPVVSSSTTYEANGMVDETPAFDITVDAVTDRLLVDEGNLVAEYDQNGVRLGTFGATEPGVLPGTQGWGAGVAVNDVTGRVYVAQGNLEGQVEVYGPEVLLPDATTEPASSIDPKGSATLNGKVKPDGVVLTECQFEYVDAEHYEPLASDPYAAGATAQCLPPAASIPTSGETQVSVQITGLTPGATYYFRLKAGNAQGANFTPDATLAMPPLPRIEAANATNVTRTTADLNVKIDPGSLHTTYHFEYDKSPYAPGEPEGKHGTSVGQKEIPAGAGPVSVEPVEIKDLEEDHTYYWRVVATNDAGTTPGVEHTFIYDTTGEGLPDHRAYEMVTPPHKNAALIGGAFLQIPPDFSEDGSRVILTSIQCFGGAQSCVAARGAEGEPFLFSRTSSGWVTSALAPPAAEFPVSSSWMVSAEAGTVLFSIPTPPMLEDDFYVRLADGAFVDIGPASPPSVGLLTGASAGATKSATSDFSRLVFQEPPYWSFGGHSETPYEFSGSGNSTPVLVGVSGGPGSTDLISACETAFGRTSNSMSPGQMSADGETVYFTAYQCGEGTGVNEHTRVPVGEVFVRIGGARTDAISEPQAPQIAGGAGPRSECVSIECVMNTESPSAPAVNPNWREALFAGASNDGSRAFFTSGQQLTDQASQDSDNLYESVCARPCTSPGERRLIDVSEGAKAHGGPRVQGVMAISADGSHVYFVAHGVLSATANAQGQTAGEGANNLYVFGPGQGGLGEVAFITQLPEADQYQWLGGNRANVTPDGRFLVFESHGALTADTTRTAGAVQVFRYDAQSGVLARVSIGEHGFNDNGNAGVSDATIVWPEGGGWYHAGASRSDPTMSHDGAYVFFQSPVGLTAHALNDVQIGGSQSEPTYAENVYEWHEGHVYLISDGRDTWVFGHGSSAVQLYDVDATGSNVFFRTADPLSELDTDTQVDYYDARVCTKSDPCVSQPPPPLPPCLGEACHGTPAAQLGPPSAGTVAFNGQGNLSEPVPKTVKAKKGKDKRVLRCSKGRRRVRGRCMKMRAKRGKAGKARTNRGGK